MTDKQINLLDATRERNEILVWDSSETVLGEKCLPENCTKWIEQLQGMISVPLPVCC